MTPAAAVLFVFVTHGAMPAPAGDVVAACLRALPRGVRPVTRAVPEAPPDATVEADASGVGAAAAVVVSWSGADLLSADVRAAVGLPDRARWLTRRVIFASSDQVAERARALGLVIASMVDEIYETPPAPPPATPPSETRAVPAPAAVTAVPAGPPEPAELDEAREDAERPGWGIDAVVTTGLEQDTDGDDMIGGAIGVRRFLPYSLALRGGAAFRFTQRDSPDITTRTLGISLGLAWAAASFGRPGHFGVGARADAVLMRQSVRVSQAADAGERVYWSAGLDALAEIGLGLSRGTTLMAATGVEELFTEATAVIPASNAATLPRARILLELGILSRF